jgi:hypothetical protein
MSEEDLKDKLINKLKEINDPVILEKVSNLIDKQPPTDDQTKGYLERLAFEHNLINRRLTWLLTSQTIFFAAAALALAKEVLKGYKCIFLTTVSGLGFSISIFILIGVSMGIRAKYLVFKHFKEKHEEKKQKKDKKLEKGIQWGVDTTVTAIALIPDVLMPLFFALAWGYIWFKIPYLLSLPGQLPN